MSLRFIGFPIKDGCHVEGADMGIDVIKEHIEFDKIIKIDGKNIDLETLVTNDLKLAKLINKYQNESDIPVTIGGDHALAIGSIAGSAHHYEDLGVIWIDTHPDSNTNQTTVTFNIHGYPLAASMGFGQEELTNFYDNKIKVDYKNVVMFGINDIDKPEQRLIDKYNIKTFTLDDINNKGLDTCIKEAILYLKDKVKNIHLSFDIDVINPDECPGVNVPNKMSKGITKEEALKAFTEFNKKTHVVSIDIVEYNPLKDKDNKALDIVLEAVKIIKKIYK